MHMYTSNDIRAVRYAERLVDDAGRRQEMPTYGVEANQ